VVWFGSLQVQEKKTICIFGIFEWSLKKAFVKVWGLILRPILASNLNELLLPFAIYEGKLSSCTLVLHRATATAGMPTTVRMLATTKGFDKKIDLIKRIGVPQAPDEEDLNARKLLRLADSAGPVSPTCFNV
jgi:hypothetical protein